MDITLDKKSPLEASIKIKLKEVDYQPKLDEKVKDYSKKAHLKGFRKGKVPTSLIRKMYGKSLIVEEINHLVSHSLTDYIKENDLKLIGDPLPNMDLVKDIDWENQKDFEFEYSVGLVDDFTLDVSKKVKVKSYEIDIDDKTLNETIENLQKQHGNVTNPEESIETDSLYGELAAGDGDFSKELLIPIESVEKKERKILIGIKSGTTVEFDIQKAFMDSAELAKLLETSADEAAAMSGSYKFTLKNVNRTEPAELNQEFFDKLFGKDVVKDEADFRERVKTEVAKNYHRDSQYFLEKTVKDVLVDKTKIKFPDEFLKKWLLHSNEGKVTEADVEKEYDLYVQDLKWSLIVNKLTEDQGIKVEHEDVKESAKNLIRQQFGAAGMSEQFDSNLDSFADNYLQGQDGQNYMRVYNQVRAEKIMQYMLANVTITPKKVKPEEFQKIVLG